MTSVKKKSCLIIAEAGVNHNGDINLAFDLIDAAKYAGADAVKFQTFIAEEEISELAPKADYQKEHAPVEESQLDMVRKLELNRYQHEQLIKRCQSIGIQFMSSAFDLKSIQLLEDLGMEMHKIPSGEITNLPLLRAIGSCGKPVLLSTGMAQLGEIDAAMAVLIESGMPRDGITLLHCNTEYPTPMDDVNLCAMNSMRDAFKLKVGYSDHTLGAEVAIAAVAMGACVIEKHLTMDRSLRGPDHAASAEPEEFRAMVQAIRNIETAFGDGIKRASPSESKNRVIARKSIVATREISAGELFGSDNLTTKRPGDGISPMKWDDILGQRAKRSFLKDEMIEL